MNTIKIEFEFEIDEKGMTQFRKENELTTLPDRAILIGEIVSTLEYLGLIGEVTVDGEVYE